ncbi:MAG TPA: formate/nitrite transporter family protein [Clostridiales bacterium]|jgi:formate/nitrite transporter|nr:formate/nitrite transporter family protein [Clostridiales bacterium]
MSEKRLYLTPPEIAAEFIEIGAAKTRSRAGKLIVLGILAGAFIAFASQASNYAVHGIASAGLAKTLAGALFTAGLMLVIAAGGELFTGNSLIVISCLERKSKWTGLLRNWFYVYLGNFLGSLLIAFFIVRSGQLNASGGALGGFTIKTAAYKTGLPFENAFLLGLLCNWLVCLAVWMSAGARDMTGRLLAIFFPIWLFITSGFEHSVANMYYISAGIMAKSNPEWVQAAYNMGVTSAMLDNLNIVTFFTKNLIPVTLGNIAGGVLFVGISYWFCYLFQVKE